MGQEEMEALTKTGILEDEVFFKLFEISDEVARARTLIDLQERAAELGVKTAFTTIYRAKKKEFDRISAQYKKEVSIIQYRVPMKIGKNGEPLLCVENFSRILDEDPEWKDIFLFNELSGTPEWLEDGKPVRWVDKDDSRLRAYIEKNYGIYSKDKLDDALRVKFYQHRYHPIRDRILALKWDGIPRIEGLLHKWMGVEDSPYSREVSRLIFAGGVNRAFNPGCKFDDMAVLVGKRQGEGKSTFVRWLAMEDQFYREVTEIEGQRGIEAIEGAWICEMGELLALKRTKDVEMVKSYVSRQVDAYRRPFDKRVDEHPRQCIFIGTTNNIEFLTDKTGNRRYYPVVCNNHGRDLFDREEEVRADIAQCWAEAYERYKAGNMPAVANRDLLLTIQEKQAEAVEDDFRVGMIADYLESHDTVCILELWEKALKEDFKPSKRDSNDISLIMQNMEGWEKSKSAHRYGEYGVQKVWTKVRKETADEKDFIEI